MSEGKPTIVWTCNRCKATVTLESAQQPKDWGRLTYVTPPRRDPASGERTVVWDLCHDCDSALADFIYRPESRSDEHLTAYLDRVKRAYDTGEVTHGEAVAKASEILDEARSDGA